MNPSKHLNGLIAAPFTPMNKDGSLNLDAIAPLCSFLVSNGVKGAFICGSTGEGPSLTHEEKKAVIDVWGQVTPKGFTTISLLGGNCGKDAQDLMRHSKAAGLDAVAIVAPNYFPLPSVEELVDYCVEISSVVPEMPVYYYHIPVLTGAHFSMLSFLEYAEKKFPNLAGIKFTEENLMDFKACIDFVGGKYDILWGRDEVLIAGMTMGGKAAVGSTYNYAAPLYLKIIDAFEKGNLEEARKLQEKSIEFIRLLGKYGGIAVGKSFMKMVGMDCGEFRSPVKNPTPEQLTSLAEDLDRIGFFEYCNLTS